MEYAFYALVLVGLSVFGSVALLLVFSGARKLFRKKPLSEAAQKLLDLLDEDGWRFVCSDRPDGLGWIASPSRRPAGGIKWSTKSCGTTFSNPTP